MLTIITGAPGSGKTYYTVKLIRDQYCTYSKEMGTWSPRINPDNNKPYTVFTNIENLILFHRNLDIFIDKCKVNIKQFFSYDYQIKVSEKYSNLVYIIDECQQYFDQKMNDTNTLLFFEKHRHLGIDIVLLAQTYERINRYIRGLEELQIHAVKRTFSVFGEFQYNIKSGNEIVDKKILRKEKSIFELYKSRIRAELTKGKNPLKKYFIFSFIIMIISFSFFYFTFLKGKKPDFSTEENIDINQTSNNSIMPKKTISQKIDYETDSIKYYYQLSTMVINHNGREIVYYIDHILNDYLPLEIIDNPIIKIPSGIGTRYIVVCNSPNLRYIPVRQDKKNSEKIEISQDYESKGVQL